ncbi:MAG: peptidylprolyl isomerase [Scytolyngbya sp. HA4215-MV1]|jgi:parvulin-like peptidyl-prolyl isomerase|nr:peptidylprolyl isomerase [Scytolyngbya sp. HA4215-MV1]
MAATPFLTVDEQPLSLSQCLKYLQSSGKLQSFLSDILRQYVLEQELQTREDIDISSAVIEQAVINFRLQQKLTEPKAFQEWLTRNGLDYNAFHSQIVNGFKLEKLKTQLSESKLQEYFIERKLFLDRVVVSRIVVDSKELAEELRSQIDEGAKFENLAQQYSIAEDRVANGMMGPVSRGTMPDTLRALVDAAVAGDLVGPVEIEKNWGLFRVEQLLPASLEDPKLKQALQNELFERWIAEKLQKMTVKLQVNE